MIHVVTHALRGVYAQQIAAMHRMRREAFIVGKGWKLQEHNGGEYDRGDDEQAVYLMMLDDHGGLQVSVRLRPVLDWSILLDEMAGCVEDGAETLRRPDIWEMARHLANAQGRSVGEAKRRSAEFRVAMLEAARARKIARIVGSVDVGLLAYGLRAWLDLRPLGLPVVYPEGGAAVGFEIPVTDDLINRLRRQHAMLAPQAFEAPPVAVATGVTGAQIEQNHRAKEHSGVHA
ncbi:MAG: acyl-homoserine-lactone synthase [Caulobacter sp.]|nr:acyl-homoserine-lactone synthase [Caulobacter sp.]